MKFLVQKRLGPFFLDAQGELPDGLTGLFGDSGAGKTSLLNCLGGFLKPDKGEIRFGEQVYFSSDRHIHCPPERRKVGMVFQEPLLFPHRSVRQNILYGWNRKETDRKYVQEVIETLHLAHLFGRDPAQLSGGEQQRVAIGRALVYKPTVLLMDEPVSSLDLKSRYQILSYLRRIHQTFGIPILYVSHSISEHFFLVNKVLVMETGRIVATTDPWEAIVNRGRLTAQALADLDNVYELPVLEKCGREDAVVLDFGGQPLKVACPSLRIQPRLRVLIKARDIIVAKTEVKDISARNCFPAVLEKVERVGQLELLGTSINGRRCLVEITQEALTQMGMEAGQKVYLIIKASSVIILD